MIPKIIHYCWFGGADLPPLALQCIESWKRILPEYELKRWDETTFDVNKNQYTAEAFASRKFAYVTDYVRLYVLYHHGGIYMDTDVEVLKDLDRYLVHDAFSGFEDNCTIPTGLMAARKGSDWARDMLSYYDNKSFLDAEGNPVLTTNTSIISKLMKAKGVQLNNTYQEVENYVVFYPSDYFCPKSHETGLVKLTPNTACLHHFAGSWLSNKKRMKRRAMYLLVTIFGEKALRTLKAVFNR